MFKECLGSCVDYLAIVTTIVLGCCATASANPFVDGEKVVMLGDSVTHYGSYVKPLQDFYYTRFPLSDVRIFNCGVGGESSYETPFRLERDVISRKPTSVVILLGMNDVGMSGYLPGATGWALEQRQKAVQFFTQGMTAIYDRLSKNIPDAKIIWCTPIPWDDELKFVKPRPSVAGVTKGEVPLCDVVRRLHAEHGGELIDFYAPMLAYNRKLHAKDPYASLSPDRIHPQAPGGLFMLSLILDSQGVDATVSDVVVDVRKKSVVRADNASVGDLRANAEMVAFTALERALPFSVDSKAGCLADDIGFDRRFNREMLSVIGLADGDWTLSIDGKDCLSCSASEWKAGVNLALCKATPMMEQARDVAEKNAEKSRKEQDIRSLWVARCVLSRRFGMPWHSTYTTEDLDNPKIYRAYLKGFMSGCGSNPHHERKMFEEFSRNWERLSELEREVEQMHGAIRALAAPKAHRFKLSRRPVLALTNTLESASLRVDIARDGGGFEVVDKRTGRRWRNDSGCGKGTGLRPFRAVGVEKGVDSLVVRLADAETGAMARANWKLKGNELVVEFEFEEKARPMEGKVVYPAPIAVRKGDALIAPISEGCFIPVDEEFVTRKDELFAWNCLLCMPFFGVQDQHDGSGCLVVLETSDDAMMAIFRTVEGRIGGVAPGWQPSLGAFGYCRRARYVYLDRGGYVAMAKRYRETAKAEGLVRTLREKCRKVPGIDTLVGAANIWYRPGDGDPSQLEVAKECRAAGFGRMLWSSAPPTAETAEINRLGDVLTSRYDCYRDVYRPELLKALGRPVPVATDEVCSNTSAWPDDIILRRDGDTNSWETAWAVTGKDGKTLHTAAMCTLMKPKHLRKNLDLELKKAPYSCRFVDVTAAVGFEQCYSSRHRMTRTQSRGAALELLGALGDEYGLVAGSEQGIGALVPHCDYFEGMLSPWYARMPHGRPGAQRSDIFRDPPVPTNVTSGELGWVERFGTGARYRIPLFELVFHDCCCAHWWWYDYSNRPLYLWKKRDLLNCLYGTAPMYVFDHRHWREHKDEFVRSYRRVVPLVRRVGYEEMIDHRALDAARDVQESRFSDGTVVTVNFGKGPFTLTDGTQIGSEKVRVVRTRK